MKYVMLLIPVILSVSGMSQNLQIHYDFRHSMDPEANAKNFPTFNFEYFKNIDTTGSGSFLLKFQAANTGKNSNIGEVFTQISQSLKFWKPKIYLSLNYSGGLGVLPSSSGYYISNSFGMGPAFSFQWKSVFIATSLLFRYNAFDKPSYDPEAIFYFGKGFFRYKLTASGSFTFWTENRNQGNDYTQNLKGKKFAFFGDPQVWVKIKNGFSLGSRINVYYHIYTTTNRIQFYPTLGGKYQF